jgi:mRNA interferase RelE/StbE
VASYQIEWKRTAAKDLQSLPAVTIARVVEAVAALADNPHPHGAIKLTGSDQTYRLRVGDYRVVYSIHQAVLVVEIIRVAHRRDVYR